MWPLLREIWPWLVVVADLLAAGAATMHAVLWRRDTRAVIGWVGLIWLAPILGAVAYFCFGVNRIRRRAQSLGLRATWTHQRNYDLSGADATGRDQVAAKYPNLVGLATLVGKLTDRRIAPGNTIEPLTDGDQAYPAMLDAIESAEHSVNLLSYIFDSDRIGDRFVDALVGAMQRGVEVRVLIDDVGSRYGRPNMIGRLRRLGIPVSGFLPTRVPRLFRYANLRNHRKILVVDGKIGFTGGTNIREGHCLELAPKFPVRCLHFRLTGGVVSHLQEAFAVDWAFATGEQLVGESWFPKLSRTGDTWARGIPHGPDEDFEIIHFVILAALAAATGTVRIATPYFLPDASIIHALNIAAMRGVEVKIILPEVSNVRLAQWASQASYWQVLEHGCRIFLSPPPFDHTKLLLVDGIWTLLGSTNWDPRSLRLNFEFNVECYQESLAGVLEGDLDARCSASREITLSDVQARGLPVRLRDGVARLFSPYL